MHSHVGRIDETDDGVAAPVACDRCVEDECESSCHVYTEAARLKYHKKDARFGCSRCTKRDKPCSLTTNAKAAAEAAPPALSYEELVAEVAALRSQLEQTTAAWGAAEDRVMVLESERRAAGW
ncbi:hypothetical protein LTR37_013866 [Vermiconidia calcicola]|uniref:Uncharacterized protein n=1 Tax=Vermiconidia calcicola TaxID=1690605 RepID=A0ACC3MW12_9PEZI|nr:hypothetical protein LTR37_013866 [Vermiconidia calcicola]